MNDERKILIVDDSIVITQALIEALGAGIQIVGSATRNTHEMLKCMDHPNPCHYKIEDDPHNPASQHAKKKRGKSSKNRYGSPFDI
tara:strand:+ start:15623 stop:15880 length:258 start_codon:yes stop_codon:yes gene_type:complete